MNKRVHQEESGGVGQPKRLTWCWQKLGKHSSWIITLLIFRLAYADSKDQFRLGDVFNVVATMDSLLMPSTCQAVFAMAVSSHITDSILVAWSYS